MHILMNKMVKIICILSILGVLSPGCTTSPASTPHPPTKIPALPTPTITLEPTGTKMIPTITNTAAPTALPGLEVVPITSMRNSVPWLPIDDENAPMAIFYGFNFAKPPFHNVNVRKAFASAIDKDALVEMAIHYKFENVTPATTLTPPTILGQDLYNTVGMKYDPAMAKSYLEKAGFTDPSTFPEVRLVVYERGTLAPNAHYNMAKLIRQNLKDNLGVNLIIEVGDRFTGAAKIYNSKPTDLYLLAYGADIADPSNFLSGLLSTTSEYNLGKYSNRDFDKYVEEGFNETDPLIRQDLYIKAERRLTEVDVAIIPLIHTLFYKN